jgi:aryl-alcohol dehydrogenase-like predicted oxidoreductase
VTRDHLDRREFLKLGLAAAAAGTVPLKEIWAQAKPAYNAHGLPTAVLGKTGIAVPRIGIGLGSRYCAVTDEDKAQAILSACLDHGFYYWDSAYSYRNKDIISEERIGRALKGRRPSVFLATKCESRTFDGAMREAEESLKRLQTDHFDLYQIHLIQSPADAEAIGSSDGVLKALMKLKEEKTARFIGFTGHLSAEGMAEAARRYDFDTMLIALNHYQERKGDMESGAIPAAAAKKMGIMIIKAIRPRETVREIPVESLIRYSLSLPLVHSAVIGTDSVEVVRKNAALLKSFKPLTAEEMKALTVALEPFMDGTELPWMKPGYKDGGPC